MIPLLTAQKLKYCLLPIHAAAVNFWINTFFQIPTRSLYLALVYEAALVLSTSSDQTVTFRRAISYVAQPRVSL
jgi:hypothetical protein